jgi:FMN reductase
MATDATTRLLVVIGSVTAPGRLHRALEEAIARAREGEEQERALEVELIDLAERRLYFVDGSDPDELDDDSASVIAAVFAADAVVFATPVYRGSMTGALKNVLDLLPVPALDGKVVALAAMGGSDHHFLGADRHLRDVLSFFGALVTPVSVYLSAGDFSDGVPSERAVAALDELIRGALHLAEAIEDQAQLAPSPLGARMIRR